MKAPLWDRFAGYLYDEFDFTLTDDVRARLATFLADLKEYNAIHNLVSANDDESLLFRHIADSLAGIPIVQRYLADNACTAPRMADLGSGGGFPGLPLCIAIPHLTLTSVESVGKKCTFQQQAAHHLGLPVTVLNDRIETIGHNPQHRAGYDMVSSRALSALSPNLEYGIPLLKQGGILFVYKSEKYPEEIEAAQKAAATLGATLTDIFKYELPLATETKHFAILVYRKDKATPGQYPRKVGIPQSKPL